MWRRQSANDVSGSVSSALINWNRLDIITFTSSLSMRGRAGDFIGQLLECADGQYTRLYRRLAVSESLAGTRYGLLCQRFR